MQIDLITYDKDKWVIVIIPDNDDPIAFSNEYGFLKRQRASMLDEQIDTYEDCEEKTIEKVPKPIHYMCKLLLSVDIPIGEIDEIQTKML